MSASATIAIECYSTLQDRLCELRPAEEPARSVARSPGTTTAELTDEDSMRAFPVTCSACSCPAVPISGAATSLPQLEG